MGAPDSLQYASVESETLQASRYYYPLRTSGETPNALIGEIRQTAHLGFLTHTTPPLIHILTQYTASFKHQMNILEAQPGLAVEPNTRFVDTHDPPRMCSKRWRTGSRIKS